MFGGFALLLWIGAILCFVAHGITIATHHGEAPNDNVCRILFFSMIIKLFLVMAWCCFNGCSHCYRMFFVLSRS
jgi:sodium/potassium-transporting ATPase subunit alpha